MGKNNDNINENKILNKLYETMENNILKDI